MHVFGSGELARKPVLARRARRATVLGVAGLGACAVLAACSPVKMGAAAIVGNQRVTLASLDTQVANLKTAAKPYGSAVTLSTDQMAPAVLSWLIRFGIMDRLAADHGISVSQAQVQQGIAAVNSEAKTAATQMGASSPTVVLLDAGISPQMTRAIGRYQAQEIAYAKQVNGGTLPTTSAANTAVNAKFTKAQCSAAKELSIQVSPQFGRMDYTQYSVVAATSLLSRPEGAPSPAPTTGLVPAC